MQEILDRIYKNVMNRLQDMNKVHRTLFHMTYNYKAKKISKGYNTPICDKYFMPSYFSLSTILEPTLSSITIRCTLT